MPQVWAVNNKGLRAQGDPIVIAQREVVDAYFGFSKKAVAASTSNSTTTDKKHTVAKKETLYSIAKANSTTVAKIKQWNGLSDNLISPGDVLIVGKQTAQPASSGGKTYTVVAKDTLTKIAGKHKVTVSDLKKWNKLSSDSLDVGDVLFVSKPDEKLEFEKTSELDMGEPCYLVVDTRNLRDKSIRINVLQGVKKVIADKEQALTLLVDGKETIRPETTVGAYAKKDYTNADDLKDLAIFKLSIQPKDSAKQEEWRKAVKESGEKFTQLFVLVDAHSGNDLESKMITYKGLRSEGDTSDIPNHFLNEEKRWLKFHTPNDCGASLKAKFRCVKYNSRYGPKYLKASTRSSAFSGWSKMIKNNKLTAAEKKIIVAVTENEGKFESLHSYDSEIFSIGIIQKTVNPSGQGEFPKMLAEFKEKFPKKYEALFVECGWTITGNKKRATMYYQDPSDDKASKITGSALKKIITNGFNASSYGKDKRCKPLEPILRALKDKDMQEIQVLSVIKRLNKVLALKPVGHTGYTLKDFLKSNLGRATVLDHHINRPAYVDDDFGAALTRFFASKDKETEEKNKRREKGEKALEKLSRNPADWGNKHAEYEKEILDDYGVKRRMSRNSKGQPVAPKRYRHLKSEL